MAIRYSIIIPTFNRAHQLLLTLVSFNTQTYPKDRFEVIVADDGSTDGTRQLVEGFQASYPLRYVAHSEQRGRSAVRNLGLRHATGMYIIFCDADFLVLPEFIDIVSRYNRKYPRAVISGIPYSWDSAYTHYYPDYSPEEKELCRQILTPSGVWNPALETATEIVPLITPEDLLHQTGALSKVVIPSKMPAEMIDQVARTDVAPWMQFVTRCVAIRRSQLQRIGGFNEQFVLYGLEDWDLGYRLHRLKIPFRCIKAVVGYHQEHPAHLRGTLINDENVKILYRSHGFKDPALNLFALLQPSENLIAYKTTLRVLRRGIRSKSTRSTARLLRRTLRLAARQFYQQKPAHVYQRSLRWIQRKARYRKSPVAHLLRDMLARSERLTK
ncbi:glycosyltransferase family 2 protein [Cohnella sp. REN36]|uniref:glycosyltransferase family 2 protein n=1 Tax=Cohnella sp. REN36 TaxID=2887347 RepID=UPI001D159A24|nr:glycosyltransferase [Cohnella sp. REN36]MCC3374509.1 glycosyltransferase [Cohnella sp. REN36]